MIRSASQIADVVVVSVHWGIEITNTITEQQYSLAQEYVDWGADLILGTQPHTIQSMEFLEKPDGGQAFVAYSLGNFISAQERNLAMLGVAVDLQIKKSIHSGAISIENVKAIPLVTHYESDFANVRVYPYSMYTRELAENHGVRERGEFSLEYADHIIRNNIPEEFLALENEN